MSNKSGTSNQVISTPKGGGALSGIGETFSPDLFTGTGNFTVPIALPPGRNGFQPQLSLNYSTGNGNGSFGQGWNLSIPGVSRKTSKGVPRYQDGSADPGDRDVFILSDSEGLVPVSDMENGITHYQPRTEGLFARIEHHQDTQNSFWRVRSKDGLISFYGTPNLAANDPAVIADPANPGHVYMWNLSATEDPFGNRIEYDYEQDQGDNGQVYLRQIRYVDFGPVDQRQFLVSVDFIYEERPDPFSVYRSGFEIRTRRRCSAVEIRTNAVTEQLTRRFDFVYLDQREGFETDLPHNGVSSLSQILVTGIDESLPAEAQEQSLPPLDFGYTAFDPESRDFFPLTGADMPYGSLARPELETVDLFGNGLPDVIQMNGVVRYWRNLGNGQYDRPQLMTAAPGGLRLSDQGVQLVDTNGDGRADLLATTNGLAGYFSLQFDGTWDQQSFQRYNVAPSFNLEDPEVKLVDLDGDGVTDAIRSGTRLELFYFDQQEGWHRTQQLTRQDLDVFPNVNFSDPRVKWGDMSGDGLQDIALVHDGNVEYWPYMGHGNWGERIHMHNSPRFPYGYDPRHILVGDVDGDGVADIVYVDHCSVLLWINQSGNGWSDPIKIDGTPPMTDVDAVRLDDMLGSGIQGVLWSADAGSRDHMFFLDFSGGVKPYLLNVMNNNMGAETRVSYVPSTEFYLQDQALPETRWQTTLPFPVQVVDKVEVIDHLARGKLTTEYKYHHGYWDGAEREFRGFGRVDQCDTEIFSDYNAPGLHGELPFDLVSEERFSQPTLSKTWFAQGPIGPEHGDWFEADYSGEFWTEDPGAFERPQELLDLLSGLERRNRRDAIRSLRGTLLRSELYALDGTERVDRPYTVTESLYSVREEAQPIDVNGTRQRIFFPHMVANRTTQWERGDDPMTQFGFTTDYDPYGQPRRQFSLAVPRGRDYREPAVTSEAYLGTLGVTDFAQRDDDDHFMVNRAARTTGFEILNDGTQTVFELRDAVQAENADLALIGLALSFYDGDAFTGLPFGQLGEFGVVSRSESLELTDAILLEAYRDDTGAPAVPPYLTVGAPPVWTDDYPQSFREQSPALAGYRFHDGSDGLHVPGYYSEAGRQFDFHNNAETGRGLPVSSRDPLGRETSIAYDDFDLLPVRVTDAVGLSTTAEYDYRVLQPRLVMDPNLNRAQANYTPLGLLETAVVMGKVNESLGDTEETPGTQLSYDLLAFGERQQPVSVTTVIREHHVNDTHLPLPERDSTLETVEFSDGFGRLLQTRTQAEDVFFGDATFADDVGLPRDQPQAGGPTVGQLADPNNPRVIVSGWQIYDNKGQAVEKFEPYFATNYHYSLPTEQQMGQAVRLFYDPRGQVIRTVNPDGSEQRVIYGVPLSLDTPESFIATPWEAYTYDANDLAPLSEGPQPDGSMGSLQNRAPTHHHFTPSSIRIDALGRTVESIQRNRNAPDNPGEPLPPIGELRTASSYDIRGNLLTVTDALERVAFRYAYDLANNGLRVESIDAGLTRTVLNVLATPIEQRDSKGALALNAYDELNRPIRFWARDDSLQTVSQRQHLIYGDSAASALSQDEARQRNLLGQALQHYDEAGRIQVTAYDFKGNLLEKTRQVISDQTIMTVFDGAAENDWQVPAFQIDWDPPVDTTLTVHAQTLLDPTPYTTTMVYDALNRTTEAVYPEDVEGQRRVLTPSYNRAGSLASVALNGETFVEQIAYSAKGQRTLIAYGNGIMTRYAYDPHTFRLARLRSERFTETTEHSYQPGGLALQDFAYAYDLVGNINATHDRTPASGIPNTLSGINALDRHFNYDAIYRLLSATGREHDRPPDMPPWIDIPKTQDATLTRAYTENYLYDLLGNMEQLQHIAAGGNFTRNFNHENNSNRLLAMNIGQTDFDYQYGPSGNMTHENTSRHFEWNHSNQMRVYRTQTAGAEPSVYAHYLYGADGVRMKKLVRRQGGVVTTTAYIDGAFEHHIEGNIENNSLHVMDDQQRIALVRVGTAFPDDATPAIKFYLGDHLGSCNVVVDIAAVFINREEHTPYGETSFGGFARKRYRFTGKERDEESGLSYHGARYYAGWLGRWTSTDPIGIIAGVNLFSYVLSNPLRYFDNTGYAPVGGTETTVVAPFVDQVLRDKGISYSSEINFTANIDGEEVTGRMDRAYLNPDSGNLMGLELKGDDPNLRSTKGQSRYIDKIMHEGLDITVTNASGGRSLGLVGKTFRVDKSNFAIVWKGNLTSFQKNISKLSGGRKISHRYFNRGKWHFFNNADDMADFVETKRKTPDDFKPPRSSGRAQGLKSSGLAGLALGGVTFGMMFLITRDAKAAANATLESFNPAPNLVQSLTDDKDLRQQFLDSPSKAILGSEKLQTALVKDAFENSPAGAVSLAKTPAIWYAEYWTSLIYSLRYY